MGNTTPAAGPRHLPAVIRTIVLLVILAGDLRCQQDQFRAAGGTMVLTFCVDGRPRYDACLMRIEGERLLPAYDKPTYRY
jgi:hypothetical protein